MTDDIPPYGQPLTAENAKLAKYSMVRADGVLGFCIGEVEPGLMAIDPFGSGNKFKIPYKDVTFIARSDPANPGWYLEPEGGFPENPVPGKRVQVIFKDPFPNYDGPSEGTEHWGRLVRFRIVDEPDTNGITVKNTGETANATIANLSGGLSFQNECQKVSGEIDMRAAIQKIEEALTRGAAHSGPLSIRATFDVSKDGDVSLTAYICVHPTGGGEVWRPAFELASEDEEQKYDVELTAEAGPCEGLV